MKKYYTLFLIELKKTKEYLLNTVLMISMLPLQTAIYIFLCLWLNKNQAIDKYQFSFLVVYYIGVLVLKSIIMPAGVVTYYIYDDIRKGKLDRLLLLPVSYIKVKYIERATHFFISTGIGVSLILMVNYILPNLERTSFLSLLLFLVSMLLGFTILFFLFASIGILSFWFENTLSLRDIVWIVLQLLTGEMVPLFLVSEKFPIINYLPTSYVYYYPIMFLQGKVENPLLVLIIQFLWVCIFGFTVTWMFKVGVSNYESQGG